MRKNIFIALAASFLFIFGLTSFVSAATLPLGQSNDLDLNDLFQDEGSGETITETVEISATVTPIPEPTREPGQLFVSKQGANTDGTSWETAWNELDQIDWSIVVPGDVIFIDGGAADSSMVYTSTLKPTVSGASDLPITIQLAVESGRNGQAVFFGGNGVLLPECGQLEWDASQLETAGRYGIEFENGVSNLIVDGTKRGGITIHGWSEAGINFDPDRINNERDDNTQNITLRYMEIYNNGKIERVADNNGDPESTNPELFFPFHGSPGIKLSGSGHQFEFLEIHDNAADGIQSNFTSPENDVFNNIDNITVSYSWFYNQRSHSGADYGPEGEVCSAEDNSGCDEFGAPSLGPHYYEYPAEPANRREAFNWCTHNDGIQIYSSQDLNNLVLDSSIFGPNLMNALILGDRGEPNTTAWVDGLEMENVIITRFTNNALGMNNNQPNVGSNWNIDKTTIYGHFNKQNMASLSLQSKGAENEHLISNSINVFGRSEFPEGNVEFDNNCEFNMYTGSIFGTNEDPQFVNINQAADYFEDDMSVDFATVFVDDYEPQNINCMTSGSRLTSVAQLLEIFADESAAARLDEEIIVPTATPAPTATPEPTPEPTAAPEEVALVNSSTDGGDQPQAAGDVNLGPSVEEIRLLILLGILAFIISIMLALLLFYAWHINSADSEL